MDGDPLGALFHRYKCGTKYVVQWLATTAMDKLDTLSLQSLSINNHGKGKKCSTAHRQTVYKLSTRDLLRLSETLATAASSFKPAPIGLRNTIIVLEDVISGRLECAEWYSSTSVDMAGNESHRHFIDVLSQILNDLKFIHENSRMDNGKAKANSKRKGKGKGKESDSASNLDNIYQQLFLEETEVSQTEAQQSQLSKKAAAPANPVVFELQDAHERDRDLALWCFLKDCYEMRRSIRKIWVDYLKGDISLLVASRVTDDAIWLIDHAAAVFSEQFPELNEFDKVADYLEIRAVSTSSNLEEFACKESRHSVDLHIDEATVPRLVCIQALTGLSLFRRLTNFHDIPGAREELENTQDVLFGFHPFWLGFLASARDLYSLYSEPDRLSALWCGDAFTNVALTCYVEGLSRLPLHSVIAFQIHHEIAEVFGIDMILAMSKLRSYTASIKTVLNTFDAGLGEIPHASKLGDEFKQPTLRTLILNSITLGLETPPKDPAAAELWVESRKGKGPPYSPLYAHFPVLNGQVMWALAGMQQLDGITVSNRDTTLISIVHLYKTCLASGYLKSEWRDLEFAIEQQGPKAFGLLELGVAVRPLHQAAKFFGLALGVEIKSYIQLRKHKQFRSVTRVPLPPFGTILKRMSKVSSAASDPRLLASKSVDQSQRYAHLQAIYQTAQHFVSAKDAELNQLLERSGRHVADYRPRRCSLYYRLATPEKKDMFCLATTICYSTAMKH